MARGCDARVRGVRVVIDGRMLSWSGIGRYTAHLLEELAVLAPDDELVVLRRPDGSPWCPPAPNVRVVEADLRPYSLDEQLRLGALVRRLRPDLAHFVHFNAPVRVGVPYLVTIHDLTMRRFRNVAGEGVVTRLRYEAKFRALGATMGAVARGAGRVLVPSSHTGAEVTSQLRVPRRRVAVTPEAPARLDCRPEPAPGIPAGAPLLLHVGNYYPHKNLEVLVRSLALLPDRPPAPVLVLAGAPDWFEERLRRSVAEHGLSGRVVFVGRVSDAQLVWLYRSATLFVLPSLSEGFGLPGLEAMAHGLPVAAADASCLPEVYGEAAAYFDPRQPRSVADCLARLLADERRRAQLAAAGRRRAAGYSWRAMARATLAAYRAVLAESVSECQPPWQGFEEASGDSPGQTG